MFPKNLTVLVTDVFKFRQKRERVAVSARSFTAITLRYKTAGKYLCKGKTIPFEPVSICIIPEGVSYVRNNDEEEILGIHYNLLNCVFDEIQVYKVTDGEKYLRLFTRALELKNENGTGCMYQITSVLYEIFAELSKDVGLASNTKDAKIIACAEEMRKSFSDPDFSVEKLSKSACISPAYLRREFNRIYGIAPKAYLDMLRIQYARSLLETEYFSQKEIAARCGFSDVEHLRAVFKKKFGKSITKYLADPHRFDY